MADAKKKSGGMGRALKLLAIGALLLVAGVTGIGLAMPGEYHFRRSVVIDADRERVHQLVGDLKQWDQWTPFKEQDPSMKVTIGDKSTGAGASQSWTGDTGSGSLKFTRCDPESGVAYELSFEGSDTSTGGYDYKELPDDKTEVTWHWDYEVGYNPVERIVMGYFEKDIEAMFDKGLSNLKAKAEAK